MERTDNLYIRELKPLVTPADLKRELPLSDACASVVSEGRRIIQDILVGDDPRPLVIVGPCSLHERDASLEYARRLKALQDELGDRVLLVMRAYFEKPRTTIGWKGLLYDPGLDESDDIDRGIHLSRRILCDIAEIGLPTATEILDPIVPQFLCDLISWAAIGARTAESQIHRQMASGLSMPIGFKNATDGNLTTSIGAIRAALSPHAFLGINHEGKASVALTRGNPYGHVVLRGGKDGPNYQSEYVAFVEVLLDKAGIATGVIVDCSHDNSGKDHTRQHEAFLDVVEQRRAGNRTLVGLMLESFLEPGRQNISPRPEDLRYGLSVTDACIGWDETEELIRELVG
jgi:3-deoxy-7-phosphoheptulonate synthase